MTTKFIITFVLLVIVFISGILMTKKGKPYQPVVLNVHKLISLAVIVIAAIVLVNFNKETGLNTLQLSISIALAVLFIITLISGGLLSAKEKTAKLVLISHKVISLLIVVDFITLFILFK